MHSPDVGGQPSTHRHMDTGLADMQHVYILGYALVIRLCHNVLTLRRVFGPYAAHMTIFMRAWTTGLPKQQHPPGPQHCCSLLVHTSAHQQVLVFKFLKPWLGWALPFLCCSMVMMKVRTSLGTAATPSIPINGTC